MCDRGPERKLFPSINRALAGFEKRRITSLYRRRNRTARRFSLLRRLLGLFRPWFFAVTAASALVLAAGPASATDADGDTVDDAFEQATEREVSCRATPAVFPDSVHVTSQSVDSPKNDWFRVNYEPGTFDVEYVRESEGGLAASGFELELRNIVEWQDTSGDSAIQWEEIVDRTTLGSSGFGEIPLTCSGNYDEDGGVVHTIGVRSNNNEIAVDLTIARRFYRMTPVRVLTPMEVQMDVRINRAVSNPDHRLGLEVRIETDHVVSYEAESWASRKGFAVDESEINVSAGGGDRLATVFFAWSNTAEVEEQSGRVSFDGPDLDSGGDGYDMVLGYPLGPSPAVVEHSASLGVVSAAYDSWFEPRQRIFNADLALFSASLAAVAAIIAGTMVVARRRRMK